MKEKIIVCVCVCFFLGLTNVRAEDSKSEPEIKRPETTDTTPVGIDDARNIRMHKDFPIDGKVKLEKTNK